MATKKKKKEPDFEAWFIKCNATPAEIEVYKIVLKLFKEKGLPLWNRDIAEQHETHRKNIQAHLSRLIEKGMVKRYRFRQYIPVTP